MKLSQLCRDVRIDAVRVGDKTLTTPAVAGAGMLADLWAASGPVMPELEIAEVRDDSRLVEAGDLFVALAGQAVDGHLFVANAAARGAVAVIVEHLVDLPESASLVQLQVKSATSALATIAANRYGRPADVLTLIGITGTNGKTTTNFLVEALLDEAGLVPGLLGTIAYRYRGRSFPAPFTTPTPLLLHRTLAEMGEQGVRAVTLEASSHALALGRLGGVKFRVAAFTNLTQDHLDFHHTMAEYYAAKASLLHEHLLPKELGGIGVINIDDSYGRRLASELPDERRLTVSIDGPADISVLTERVSVDGIVATLRTPVGDVAITSGLTGRFNLANLALAAGIGVGLGLPVAIIGRALSKINGVAGRLERVAGPRGSRNPTVFVDYAHTPDALARSLSALRSLTASAVTTTSPGGRRGRLILVFGCGGDRDVGKRSQMGQVAARDADVVIITSDNPRTESPQSIIDAIVTGVVTPMATSMRPSGPLPRLERAALASATYGYHVESDRRHAITAAIFSARSEDVVLLAGKGHEDYQIVGTARHRFDDREEAGRALSQRESAPPRATGGVSGVMPITIAATIELPVERVVAATQGKLVRSGPHKFTAVTIDSRTATVGSLFVAVRGEHHDGHAFISQAVAAGATGLLIEPEHQSLFERIAGIAVIEVPDTVVALGQLARAHRDAPEIATRLRVVAVTGSSGKTTTKDLITAILTAHVSDPNEVLKTEGNLNNHLGVPLTLLRLRPGQRYAVVEMGMSARGEIAYLTSLARPDVGVITNVGPAHLSALGSIENVALAKGELFTGLTDGAAVVYPLGGAPTTAAPGEASWQLIHKQAVRAGAQSGRLRNFGAQAVTSPAEPPPGSVVQAELRSETEDGLELRLRFLTLSSGSEAASLIATLPLLGAHQASNAALAAAATLALDIPPASIAAGLQRVTPAKHRGQLVVIAGRRILDDCYNANPDSMNAALHTLTALRGERAAVAVLGDMLELGPTEAALHAQVGEVAAACRVSLLITVGERARHIAETAQRLGVKTAVAATAQDAAAAAAAATQPGDFILIKGSRGMALEDVLTRLHVLLENPAAPAAAQQVH